MSKETVKVVISPGYGAGWSTWNEPEYAIDDKIIEALEAGDEKALYKRAKKLGAYAGGLENAVIVKIPKGTLYRIKEKDGYETLETRDCIDWEIA